MEKFAGANVLFGSLLGPLSILGGGPGGEKRVTFGEYLFRVAEGGDAVAVC